MKPDNAWYAERLLHFGLGFSIAVTCISWQQGDWPVGYVVFGGGAACILVALVPFWVEIGPGRYESAVEDYDYVEGHKYKRGPKAAELNPPPSAEPPKIFKRDLEDYMKRDD